MKEYTKLPQLLKWVGNKQRFANEIISYMPQKINNYYEPFLGSAAVLGSLAFENYSELIPRVNFENLIGTDVLSPLIEIFNYVKHDPETLINSYDNWNKKFELNRIDTYEEVREKFNRERDALDFMFLTRSAYSGIIRFRKSDGYMSTPIGPHTPISTDNFRDRVDIWNKILTNVSTEFLTQDYRETMSRAGENDLIYCDPPYTHSQGILYGAQSFNIEELWETIALCKSRGAKVILSINGKKKSGKEDIGVVPPEGLFERLEYVNVGVSMVNRLKSNGKKMDGEIVHDALFLTY
ncbi:Dam family site-specific DNA-(adenine-N6)-methyltransferase [Enterococcus faecium]|uniref:DNA adenine methylase n=1 Tax=Enterococcus faecium TaxID=1352 RepID=UPI00280CB06D|nr:Dam family site-specific DNA-(adenine-N6)-methyltransferase [Enterococcus faecium]